MADPFAGLPSTDDIGMQRRLALQLMGQGMDSSPVGHWTQGLARVLQGGVGGMYQAQAAQGTKDRQNAMVQALQGSPTFKGMSDGERGLLTANPEIMQSVTSRALGNRFDPMAQAELGMMPLKKALMQAQVQEAQAGLGTAPLRRDLLGAQAELARAQAKAAGVKDAFGELILQQFKGAQGGGAQPQAGPQLQPQSFEGGADPMLIPTQAAPGAQAQAQPDMVDVPGFGRMPRDKARTLGMAAAASGKGDLGKLIMEEVDKDKIGKEGMNKIDEEIIAKIGDVAELDNIKKQYRPEFLEIGGRVKAIGASWQAYLNSKSVKPEDRKYLTDYAKFAAASQERMNTRIKAMSGSAVSGHEEVRLNKANPTVNDDPITYEAKLNEQIYLQKAALSRYMWLKNVRGLNHEQIANLAKSGKIESLAGLDDMRRIADERGAQLEQELQGKVPPERMGPIIRQRLKQEFGI